MQAKEKEILTSGERNQEGTLMLEGERRLDDRKSCE